MMVSPPKKAMILAAGLGSRLRPYTDTIPKPLLPVAGKALIDWTMEALIKRGIREVVVNIHYHGQTLKEHLRQFQDITIHYLTEDELLGTGGAVQAALPYFENEPFYLLQSNIIFIDQYCCMLSDLAQQWRDQEMDGLVGLKNKQDLKWYRGKGDYIITDDKNHIQRIKKGEETDLIHAGISLLHPRIFKEKLDGAYPLNIILDKAIKQEKLYGYEYTDPWYSVSTVTDYNTINRILSNMNDPS